MPRTSRRAWTQRRSIFADRRRTRRSRAKLQNRAKTRCPAEPCQFLLGYPKASVYKSQTVSGRGGTGRRNGLKATMSALGVTADAELLKVGETFQIAIPSQTR